MGFLVFFVVVVVILLVVRGQKKSADREAIKKEIGLLRTTISDMQKNHKIAEQLHIQQYENLAERVMLLEEKLIEAHIVPKPFETQTAIPANSDTLTENEYIAPVQNDYVQHTTPFSQSTVTSLQPDTDSYSDETVDDNEKQSVESVAIEQADNNEGAEERYYDFNAVYTDPMDPSDQTTSADSMQQIKGSLDRNVEAPQVPVPETLIPEKENAYEPQNNQVFRPVLVRSESVFTKLWRKIERQVAENWTGILGTIILVLGIGFLGVYTAIRVNEVIRFLMINGCAAGLLGTYIVLNKKEKWVKLSLWMRSASAAVFLFACLGAGGIPGLYWIKNPYIALSVLCIGIALNLYLSFIGSKQVFASLHVLLSLIALSVAPQNELLLVIAGLVSAFGIVLTIKERWVYHFILSSTAFFIYHIFWYITSGLQNTNTPVTGLTITGFFVSVLVFGTAMAVLYHIIFFNKHERINTTTQFMYLSTWIFFTLSIASHLYTVTWLSFPVFTIAVAAFVLGRISSQLKVQWLSTADTIVSMVYVLIAVTALSLLNINSVIVCLMIAVVMVLFVAFSIAVKEDVLYKVGVYGILLCTIGMILYMFTDNKYAVISVILLALSTFTIAEYNRRFRNRWEYGTCVVFAQVSMIIGLLSFYQWTGVNTTLINTILAIELILVTGFMSFVRELLWGRLGIVLQMLLFLVLASVLPDSTKWDIVPLFLSGAGLFILLNRNRDFWGNAFYTTGIIVSQCAIITACFGLFLWFNNQYIIHGIVLFEIIAFTIWAYKKNADRLIDTGIVMIHLFSLYLIIRVFDQDPWNIVFLFVNSCTVFILGITTTKGRIENVFNVYSISAQISCLVSFLCLYAFHVGHDIVISLILLETCLYGLYTQRIKNKILFQIAVSIVHVSTVAALVYGLCEYFITKDISRYEIAVFYSLNALVLLAFNSWITITNRTFLLFDRIIGLQSKKREMSVIGISGAILLVGSACSIYNSTILFLSIAIAGVLYLALRLKLQTNGLAAGAALLLCGIHFLGWKHITHMSDYNSVEIVLYAMILCGLAIMSIIFSRVQTLDKFIRWPGIYLLTITVMVVSYELLYPVSKILPGIVWLVLSLLIIELSRYCDSDKCPGKIRAGNTGLHLLISSYAFQIIFVLNHFSILQGDNAIIAGPIRESLIGEAVAVAAFIVSMFRTPSLKVSNHFHKVYTILLLELVIAFLITACIVTVHGIYLPLCWILYAIGAYLIGCSSAKDFSRLKIYGILFYLVSIISVVVMYWKSSNDISDWVPGLVAILLQISFLVISIKRRLFDNLSVPAPLAFLELCAEIINKYRNALLFYPLLLSIAVFFYLNFTSSLLTVLWTAECFSIFVISIMLREQHFRYVALTGVGLCLVRLVFFDLKESTTITKALVFVGVGLLMLGMNILYSKYKDRLFDDNAKS